MATAQRLVAVIAGAMIAGCASTPDAPRSSATLGHVPVVRLPDGHEAVLVRSHPDEWKLDGRDVRVTVQYLWDYTLASARVRAVGADASVISDEIREGLTLNATDEEMAWAYELARSEPAIAARITPDTTYYGGFSFRDPDEARCYAGSRCVHVIASRDDGRYKVFHAIVDLQTSRVVDPEYDPELGGLDQPPAKSE